MSTIAAIRQFIQQVPPGQPFTTRMLISCGKRANVDTALHRMSRSGEIVRLAQGVFVRGADYPILGPTIELFMTKTFKKTLFSHDSASSNSDWYPVDKTVTLVAVGTLSESTQIAKTTSNW